MANADPQAPVVGRTQHGLNILETVMPTGATTPLDT